MPHYEYDKNYPFAAFITNLGKYNEGDLVGEWVKFPTTPEEMQKVFERIGIGQKDDFGQPYAERNNKRNVHIELCIDCRKGNDPRCHSNKH